MGPHRRSLAVGATAVITAMLLAAPVPAEGESAARVPLSPCWSSDAGVPSLGTPTFTPSTVDVTDQPAEVTISLPVKDHGGPGRATGVSFVEILVFDQLVQLEPTSTNAWTGTVTVHRKTEAGEHSIVSVIAKDRAGNTRDTEQDGVYTNAVETPLTVISAPPSEPVPEPALTSLTISKQKVNVRKKARRVDFTVGVDETESTVATAYLSFASNSVELTRTSDGFTGTAKVRRNWYGTYKAKVSSVSLVDEYGYRHILGVPKRFGVEPVTVIARDDRRRPKIVRTTVRPNSVDARKKKRKVTVRVKTRDDRSGVNSVAVGLGPGISVTMRKVKGTRRSNTWRGTVRVGPCDASWSGGKIYVEVRDRAHRLDTALDTRFRMKTNDVKRPGVRFRHPRGMRLKLPDDRPIRIVFKERVTGVSARSLHVVSKDGPYDYWSSPLSGTITCRNGAGTKVACKSRKVREARWKPDPGVLQVGMTYTVILNPDGVLDIRDRSGNPARRSERIFRTLERG